MAMAFCITANTNAQGGLGEFLRGFAKGVSEGLKNNKTSTNTVSDNYTTSSQRTNVSNYSLPDKFEYYYATADNVHACKISAMVTPGSLVVPMPNGQSQVRDASVRSFLFDGTTGNLVSTSYPNDNGEYWRYSQILLQTEYNVYVKKDFSEVKYGNFVFNKKISKETYSKKMTEHYKFMERINSQVPSSNTVGGYSNNSNSSGSSSTSSSSSGYTRCSSCNGTGICSSCNGKKGHYADTGYYTGSNSQSWIACPSCNGSGRCFNCHGRGRY